MEVCRSDEYYVFINGDYSLWWNRLTAEFIPKKGWKPEWDKNIECLGICHGLVGKIEHQNLNTRLMLIKECSPVGHININHVVYKIKSVVFVQLGTENVDLNLQKCHRHKNKDYLTKTDNRKGSISGGLFELPKNAAFSKTWGTLKSAGNTIKNTTQQAAVLASNQVKSTMKGQTNIDKAKFEKRIIEELFKIFNDTDSFYFCRTGDITNTLERYCSLLRENKIDENAIWKTVDDRFFWNKHMIQDLIDLNDSLCDPWILPVIQGFVQIEHCKVDLGIDALSDPKYETFTLSLISRRSRFRAGTRYKRRGVDDDGNCANYVETEQIISYHHHQASFVQVRGSVPLFWSQPGYKYRPPPRIDKGESESQVAFEKHLDKEQDIYGPVCIVNLIDQSGKEKVIWDAYSEHILKYNSTNVTYCTFDFHEYCRGMHFENVSILINAMADVIRDMNYCWKDNEGQICSQLGIFRVNCIDCLDRTNVVQTAIGKAVMEIQFTKLGLIPPEGVMPLSIKNTFQLLWANNGDIISKQYAGTNALKGDYTRTGERKFTGIMKDGMNSANRYYQVHFSHMCRQYCIDLMQGNRLNEQDFQDNWHDLRTLSKILDEFVPVEAPNYVPEIAIKPEIDMTYALYYMTRYYLSRFKDSYRQGTIDLMLGNTVSEDIFSDNKNPFEEDSAATAEHVKLLIEDSKKLLISNPEHALGAWGLIDADPNTGDPLETEMDTILILTKDSYYVANYDDQVDKITKYQRVQLDDLTLIEFGVPDVSGTVTLFKNVSKLQHHCIRLNYKVNGVEGYYHMFRSTNLRFFNNMAVVIKNEEEIIESLKAICESFLVALDICSLPAVPYLQGQKLDRRKSKLINEGSKSIYLDLTGLPQITRNVSESQLLALKNVGSKAFSNVTEQFSKLNPLRIKTTREAKFTVGKSSINSEVNSSSDTDDDENEISIFQPQFGDEYYIKGSDSNELCITQHDKQNTVSSAQENTSLSQRHTCDTKDTYLPAVGIVMGSQYAESQIPELNVTLENKDNMTTTENASLVDNVSLYSVIQNVSIHPQNDEFTGTSAIELSEKCNNSSPKINLEQNKLKSQPPNTLKLDRKLSHSSGEVDLAELNLQKSNSKPDINDKEQDYGKRGNSEQEFYLNISQSQSESALKQVTANMSALTSPVGMATKELVLSPFSKFAKGMQNLGANLDPRKMKASVSHGPIVKHISEREYEERRKLQEKWRKCNTRLIAL